MAKPVASSSKATPAPAPAQPKKRALASAEIDDIFSKKPKLSTVPPPAAEPAKKNKGKGKAAPAPEEKPVKKGKAPETIMDTSAGIDSYRVAAPVVKKRKAGEDGVGASGEGACKEMEEEDRFMDSRGTNRRRTDDGLAIYDISELKIGLGGDSPLCPFDCDCCF